jgi:ankyrin repeat protein
LARDLLLKGANPNIEDRYGDTPLHYVARGFYFDLSIEFLIELLKAGANINKSNVKG